MSSADGKEESLGVRPSSGSVLTGPCIHAKENEETTGDFIEKRHLVTGYESACVVEIAKGKKREKAA